LFQKKIVDKIKTQILCSVIFLPPKRAVYEIMREKIWYSQSCYRWQYDTAHALSVLDNWGYRHRLRICYTYCFATI